jgi:hypothetical protein
MGAGDGWEPIMLEVPHQPLALWAYVYVIRPPPAATVLSDIQNVLDRENLAARGTLHPWKGRLVQETRAAFVLVVSGHRGQERHADLCLTELLQARHAPYTLTRMMVIPDARAPDDPASGAAWPRLEEPN